MNRKGWTKVFVGTTGMLHDLKYMDWTSMDRDSDSTAWCKQNLAEGEWYRHEARKKNRRGSLQVCYEFKHETDAMLFNLQFR